MSRTATAVLLLLLVGSASAAARPAPSPSPSPVADTPDPRWLDRLKPVDRAAVTAAVGRPAPAFRGELQWSGTEPLTWAELRGKVVVLQSWSSRSTAGRSQPSRLVKALEKAPSDNLVLLTLHTPESADRAPGYLERSPSPVPVIIDPTGAFCDDLGVYKRPVNLVIDKAGVVRYAGLNPNGLREAVGVLHAEPYDPADDAAPAEEATSAVTAAEFPAPSGSVGSARDLRGQPAPPFHVDRWLSDRDAPGDRLLLLDFWATWCGPCMAAVPHMNQIAGTYRQDICIIGITDETKSRVEQGLYQKGRKPNDFQYALASDPQKRMNTAFGIRGIPHCVIVSRDGIVRWQGHPNGLTRSVLEPLIAANRALRSGGPKAAPAPRGRWLGG